MTTIPIDHANQVAEFNASRDVQADTANAERLARWQARYPRDVVSVPATVNPPSWPARRVSIPHSNVTALKAKMGAR